MTASYITTLCVCQKMSTNSQSDMWHRLAMSAAEPALVLASALQPCCQIITHLTHCENSNEGCHAPRTSSIKSLPLSQLLGLYYVYMHTCNAIIFSIRMNASLKYTLTSGIITNKRRKIAKHSKPCVRCYLHLLLLPDGGFWTDTMRIVWRKGRHDDSSTDFLEHHATE